MDTVYMMDDHEPPQNYIDAGKDIPYTTKEELEEWIEAFPFMTDKKNYTAIVFCGHAQVRGCDSS